MFALMGQSSFEKGSENGIFQLIYFLKKHSMNKESQLLEKIEWEARKKYNELYPQFNFFWNKTLIVIGVLCIITVILNNFEIIDLGTRKNIVIMILILTAWKLLFRLWEYKWFVEWYEIWHRKWFDYWREKWIK